MKRYFTIMVALLLAVAIASPVFAAVEWKFGGQFRARYIAQDNVIDGTDEFDDSTHRIDQRLRLYFTAIASENLKVVTRFEMGDTVWGQSRTDVAGGGGRMGADQTIVELKNAYVEFRIPETPTTAIIGIQPINLMNSWIADDDFSAAVFKTKLEPVVVGVGYIAEQNNPDKFFTKGFFGPGFGVVNAYTEDRSRIDGYFLYVDYAQGPLTASFVAMYTDARSTFLGIDPTAQQTPVPSSGVPWSDDIEDNNIIDLGINLGYKLDWMSAYVSFVKNLGSVDIEHETIEGEEVETSHDYTGWMVDAGATFFCGPYTFNLGGFYTSGQDEDELFEDFAEGDDVDLDNFTYPATTAKYFSEIVGGGILDNMGGGGFGGGWSGYQFPTNLWTVTAGASWQALEKTKLSLSYWYFGTSGDVISSLDLDHAEYETANDVGHEIDFYLTQGIVDGLTLDLVAAYLFAGDAYGSPFETADGDIIEGDDDDDVYELGARLQWNF